MKTLAKDTAIYGLSSIIGRFLNYLLVPLYTYKIAAASGGYGVITNLYAYTALLLVILTYGMETTFFRFANKEGEDPKLVYSSILRMVGLTSLAFIGLVFASPSSAPSPRRWAIPSIRPTSGRSPSWWPWTPSRLSCSPTCGTRSGRSSSRR